MALFIGYPRTGASMLGALLSAHPNMVFAQDMHVTRAMELGFSREQIFSMILRNEREFVEQGAAGQGHKVGSKYSYAVPNQWQGRFEKLLVVGDKQAPGATLHLAEFPHLVTKLRDLLGIRVRIIHMIRNPFDCINGIFRLKAKRGGFSKIAEAIDFYFELCDGVNLLKQRYAADIIDERMETLIEHPAEVLQRLCTFLDVPCPEDYVKDCVSILFAEPQRTTHDILWTAEDVQMVRDKMAAVPFLSGYEPSAGLLENVAASSPSDLR